MTFVIPKERDAHDLFTSLTQMCQPGKLWSKEIILEKGNLKMTGFLPL